MSNKQSYVQPELIVYGNVETLTQKGGGASTDVPEGTVVGPNATIGDVTGIVS